MARSLIIYLCQIWGFPANRPGGQATRNFRNILSLLYSLRVFGFVVVVVVVVIVLMASLSCRGDLGWSCFLAAK